MTNEFRLPDIGEGLTEAEIVEWFVAVGDMVDADQAIVEVETAKTTVEITATHAGTVLELGGIPGDTINVGDVLFVVGEEGPRSTVHGPRSEEEGPPSTVHGPRSEEEERATDNGKRPRAMPVVRKLARERGVDLAEVTGTGPGGAITRADVEGATPAASTVERVPMSRKRKAIATHMTESWTTIPHVSVQADIRAENLLTSRHRPDGRTIPLEAVVGSTVLPLLERFREFNAVVDGDTIEYRSHFNLGFAVDTDDGLMVVVVRGADELTVDALADEFERLARAAKDGTLTPDEAVGQTFTISNIGALGGGHGTPIIPLGTSAILSIGRAHDAAVIENGDVASGLIAPIDLSYDHRLIDGSLGQRFLSALTSALESTEPHGHERPT